MSEPDSGELLTEPRHLLPKAGGASLDLVIRYSGSPLLARVSDWLCTRQRLATR